MKNTAALYKALNEKILVLDGAMGTMLQQNKLADEEDLGGRFKDWQHSLKGNNDLRSLTQPQAFEEVHRRYLRSRRQYY